MRPYQAAPIDGNKYDYPAGLSCISQELSTQKGRGSGGPALFIDGFIARFAWVEWQTKHEISRSTD